MEEKDGLSLADTGSINKASKSHKSDTFKKYIKTVGRVLNTIFNIAFCLSIIIVASSGFVFNSESLILKTREAQLLEHMNYIQEFNGIDVTKEANSVSTASELSQKIKNIFPGGTGYPLYLGTTMGFELLNSSYTMGVMGQYWMALKTNPSDLDWEYYNAVFDKVQQYMKDTNEFYTQNVLSNSSSSKVLNMLGESTVMLNTEMLKFDRNDIDSLNDLDEAKLDRVTEINNSALKEYFRIAFMFGVAYRIIVIYVVFLCAEGTLYIVRKVKAKKARGVQPDTSDISN